MTRLRPLVDCVRRGEAFAHGGMPAVAQLQLGDTETQWQRPWTFVDYAFWGGITLAVGGVGLLVWNPPLRRSR